MFPSRKNGFTLVEFMIIVAIMGILIAVAIPNFMAMQCRSFGRDTNLDKVLVDELCSRCPKCGSISKKEALQMIVDEQAKFEDFLPMGTREPVVKPDLEPKNNPAPEEYKGPEPQSKPEKDAQNKYDDYMRDWRK